MPEARYAWFRQHVAPDGFALCGVAQAVSSLAGIEALHSLVTAPFEPFDAVVCPSRAIEEMVRTTAGAYADDLRERFGGDPSLRLRLEVIPWGIDVDRQRPATTEERSGARRALGLGDEEIAVLSAGPISFHAKGHPFPLFEGLQRVARGNARKVHLLLAGAPRARRSSRR